MGSLLRTFNEQQDARRGLGMDVEIEPEIDDDGDYQPSFTLRWGDHVYRLDVTEVAIEEDPA